VQRFAAVFPAERQYGDRALVRDARNEVVETFVAPELDVFGGDPAGSDRVVEGDGVTLDEPFADARPARQNRRRTPVEARSTQRGEMCVGLAAVSVSVILRSAATKDL
jgi:hypothetical protein